jgi:hypothetical protein
MKLDKTDYSSPPPPAASNIITPGWYEGTLTSCKEEISKTNGLAYVSFRAEVRVPHKDGDKTRTVWFNLFPNHPSMTEQTKRVVWSMGQAMGLKSSDDTDDFLNQPCMMKVKTEVSKDPQYDDKNTIDGFKAMPGREVGSKGSPTPRPVATVDDKDLPF